MLGVWAHRQALAARDAGADVRVARAAPARSRRARPALRDAPRRGCARLRLRQPAARRARRHRRRATCRSLAPPRARSYGSWGAWAAPTLRRRAAPAARALPLRPRPRPQRRARGDAVLRARIGAPLVVSVHGGDVFFTAPRHAAGARGGAARVRQRAARAGQLAPASSAARARARRASARASCTSAPTCRRAAPPTRPRADARDRRRTSSRASATPTCCARCGCCASATPTLRYLVIGDGPERARARAARRASWASRTASSSPGQLAHAEALAAARARRTCSCMPSVDEAFGVAYVEAMAAGAAGDRPPAASRGRRRSPPPATGMRLVAARRRRGAGRRVDALLAEPRLRAELGARARARPSSGHSRGRSAGARRSRPTRTRCDEAPGASSSPTTCRPTAPARSRALHERVRLELALFGGRSHHATAGLEDPGVPHRRVAPARGPRPGRRRALPRGRVRARPGASRCPPPALGARRARVAVRALERAVGAT